MMRAGSASMRKSNASWPLRSACSDLTMARNGADAELGAHLADQQQIRKRVVRFGVGAQDRTNQSPLLQVAKMVFAEPRIHAEQIALRVVLLLEIFGRLDAGHPAEIVLADDPHAEVFRFAQLLTFFGARAPFRADDDHRRFRGHLVGGGPPRRITSACASLRPSDESLPVKTTT